MREKLARAAYRAQFGYEPGENAFKGPMTPKSKSGTVLAITDAVLDALMAPTLRMQNAGWAELKRQGIDPETVDIAPAFQAMIRAAKEGK